MFFVLDSLTMLKMYCSTCRFLSLAQRSSQYFGQYRFTGCGARYSLSSSKHACMYLDAYSDTTLIRQLKQSLRTNCVTVERKSWYTYEIGHFLNTCIENVQSNGTNRANAIYRPTSRNHGIPLPFTIDSMCLRLNSLWRFYLSPASFRSRTSSGAIGSFTTFNKIVFILFHVKIARIQKTLSSVDS